MMKICENSYYSVVCTHGQMLSKIKMLKPKIVSPGGWCI